MVYRLVCVLLLSSLTSVSAWSWEKDKILQAAIGSPFLTREVIAEALRARCGYFQNVADQLDCLSLGPDVYSVMQTTMVTVPANVDPRYKVSGTVPVVWTQDLKQLLRMIPVQNFLNDLLQGIESVVFDTKATLDVYALAEKYAGTPQQATRWMAVLFSDTSPMKSSMYFLETQADGDKAFIVGRQTLRKAINNLSEILHGTRKVQGTFKVYPASVTGIAALDAKIYHYYVPAWVAQKLYHDLDRTEQMSAFGGFMFNYVYEIAGGADNPLSALVMDPPKITNNEEVEDIYLGYRGAADGFATNTEVSAADDLMSQLKSDVPGLFHRLF